MKKQFALTKTNKAYFGIITVITFIFFLAFSNKAPESIGELTGRLASFALFPSFFAWIVWRLAGRQENGGSITFNILLTLIVIGQVGQIGNRHQQSQKIASLEVQKNEFKERLSTMDDPIEFDSAYNEYADSVKGTFNELSQTSTGRDKQFFEIMNGFVSDVQSTAHNWNEAYNNILSERFFDLSRLNNDEEFDYQIRTATNYVEEAKTYADSLTNMLPDLKERLSIVGEGNEMAVGAIRGASKKYDLQKQISEPLMKAHIEYGNLFIQLLEILQQNKSMWAYENNEMSIYDDSVLSKYNVLIDILTKREESINRLSAQLLETL
jgi:hypothetical protein